MSVIVVMKVPVDVDVFMRTLTERADEYERMQALAQAAGGRSHRYATGDGSGFLIDEWTSVDAFKGFFRRDDVVAFMASVGVDTDAERLILIGDAIDSPDRYDLNPAPATARLATTAAPGGASTAP
ncbi:hypothetical protein [Leifsonia shinshuensis]|uniref:ABM domain-containing protein n=1 Tax=Leifsonia shinshuensis TaxID=150026 RepID=A0A853CZ18_9MICO|nr:hypothetical protein [Leifsonia shinshuensis]NYJ24424.1 hypothetical protein [Leifsonia shinshuensis]